jgi:hypothetical protein
VGDSCSRASCADHDDAIERYAPEPTREALSESPEIGVVAERLAVREDDRIHCSERLGCGRQVVEPLEDEALARVRDVQAAETDSLRADEQVCDSVDVNGVGVDLDQLVDVAKSEAVRLSFVQRRAERRADAGANEPDEMPTVVGVGVDRDLRL